MGCAGIMRRVGRCGMCLGLNKFNKSPFTLPVFLRDNLAHGALINFAFDPGDEVQVGEGAGLVAVAFEAADLGEEFFKFGFQAGSGGLEGGAQKAEHFLFDLRQAFAAGHEAVDGFGEGFHQVEVTQFVVRH